MKDMSEETRQKLSDSMKAVWRQRRKAKKDAELHAEAVQQINDKYRHTEGARLIKLYEAARCFATELELFQLMCDNMTSEVMVHGLVSGKGASDKHTIIVEGLKAIIDNGVETI